jgi:hypothetical protein
MSVFPNPAVDRVGVSLGELAHGEYRFTVADALGRSTTDLGSFWHTGSAIELPVGNLESGIYWLRVQRPDGSLVASKPLSIKRP